MAKPRTTPSSHGPRRGGTTLAACTAALAALAPLELAESWDNVGLLCGDLAARVRRILLCIDLTEAVAGEALALRADLVVAYHPPIFRPIARLVRPGSGVEATVVRLFSRGVALYATHTALDGAPGGTNDVLASLAGLLDVQALPREAAASPTPTVAGGATPPAATPGIGRVGRLPGPMALGAFARRLARRTDARATTLVGEPSAPVRRAFVVAGSGARLALAAGPGPGDVVVTGEVGHHDALALLRSGASAVALAHFSSERPVLAAVG
ncbi:MAG: Nif3-like dinuclear metal center hexameric protein, partial [Polyangiaceae bacterium]|nr:Nif3-like dinuclear metal center hexameric protein [Polyangiaceae bacterium]